MKKIKLSKLGITLLVILFAFSLSNCSVQLKGSPPPHNTSEKKVPPGQAKKANGDKSAKKYAPGHNK
jgi:hypothetical protein